MNHRPIAPAISQERRAFGETVPFADSSRHLGSAVKQLAPPNLQGPVIVDKVNGATNGTPSIQLKRNLGARQHEIQEILNSILGKITVVVCYGCILFVSFKIMNMTSWRMGNRTRWRLSTPRVTTSTSWMTDGSQDLRSRHVKRSIIARKVKKLLSHLRLPVMQHQEDTVLGGSCHAASLSSSLKAAYKMAMPAEEAENLVKKWQTIKAEALGPEHHVDVLFDVLDESMLVQWQALADSAKDKSCFWRFVLLQLSVLRADILTDETGKEIAEIEALLEEAAELVDESHPSNPNYYSSYKIRYLLKRQDDGTWRFCEGDIQTT